jgi:hypothetical protein
MTKPHAIKFSKIADMIKNEPDKPKLFMRTRFKGLNTNVPLEIVLINKTDYLIKLNFYDYLPKPAPQTAIPIANERLFSK